MDVTMPPVEQQMAERYWGRKQLLEGAAAAGYHSPITPDEVAIEYGITHGLTYQQAQDALFRIVRA